MRKGFAFLVIVLALTALACGAINPNPEDIANNFDEISGPASGDVLLQDDFSNTSSGWSESTFEQGARGYQNGEFRILVTSAEWSVWDNPNQDFYNDVRVEVDAHRAGGPNDSEYGLICRHTNVENFYFASVTVDGYFAISRTVNGGDFEFVGMDSFQTNNAIGVGDATNHLRFDCVGSTLSLYANGVLLASVTDTALTTGDVGVYVGSFDTGGAEILFDNFIVYQP